MRRAIAITSICALFSMLMVPTSQADTARIRAMGSCTEDPHWMPSGRTIARGDRIVWGNPTSCDHTVTAYGGNWSKSSGLPPGGTTAKRFRRTGTYKFRCLSRGHSVLENGVCNGMCGRIRVTG